jgi:DNA repair protein RadC
MKVDYFTIPEITVSFKDAVRPSERATVNSTDDAARIFAVAHENCMEHHEEVNVMFLNNDNRVMGILNVAKGGISGAVVDIRIILQTALKVSASSVMLSHCHPSGNRKPSQYDLKMTEKIKTGCEAVGIKFLDHLIMTSEKYTSFAENGLL